MVTKILKTIEENKMLLRGQRVLCALSGGADSSALLDVLVKNSERLGIEVCAAHLNHMLRGEDAMHDEGFVRGKCRGYGIPLICERADVAAVARELGQSVELAARNVRYDFLRRAKQELRATKIATAHNANDNLETVLFNISRGGGIDGLCGIPPVRDDIIRPLIEVSRDEIESYILKNNISFCEDKTNADTVYSRNKIRHKAVPALVEINSRAVENAARSSKILRAEAEFLEKSAFCAAEEIAVNSTSCKREELLCIDNALFARVCEVFAKRALGISEYTLEFRHISDIRRLCQGEFPSKSIDLPLGLCVRCEYENIVFEKKGKTDRLLPIKLVEGKFNYGEHTVSVKKAEKSGKINNSVNTFIIACDRIQGDLVIRSRQEGDEIKTAKRPNKSLKKIFIEKRIPKNSRDAIPVIADDEKVFAVFGFGQDERYLPEDNSDVFIIEID